MVDPFDPIGNITVAVRYLRSLLNISSTIFGHKGALKLLRETVITWILGIEYLTAYSFSNENWQRPRKEVVELMNLFVEVLGRELEGMIENDVRLSVLLASGK